MVKLIASFFYIGYLPIASGTYASIGGLLIFFLLKGNSFYLQTLTVLIVFMGFFTCGRAEKVLKEKDSRKIVIDEVSGMLICCCFIPVTFTHALAAFFLFRVFDIIKPFPINRLQALEGSLGIMFDDICAALYTLAALNIIEYTRSILI
ncbi:MAG: phosphatidylglycerophosphatase A [Candidatus Omnitrophota bacterium]